MRPDAMRCWRLTNVWLFKLACQMPSTEKVEEGTPRLHSVKLKHSMQLPKGWRHVTKQCNVPKLLEQGEASHRAVGAPLGKTIRAARLRELPFLVSGK
eukprot:9574002-Heterocapsa_arctica.AAC.1